MYHQDLSFPLHIVDHLKKTAKRGDVNSVIDVIDKYCYNVESAMNVGDVKGAILDDCFKGTEVENALELGTYCGYSALRISRLLKENAKLYSIESNPDYMAVAQEIINFAGMEEKVQIIPGESDQILPGISQKFKISSFEFVFIDHGKDVYKRDLMLLENLGLIKYGSVVLADNVIFPGCPDYLEYVRNNPKYKCTNYPSKLEYTDVEDALEKSIYLP